MSGQLLNPGTIIGGRYAIRACEGCFGDYLHYLAAEIETSAVWTLAEYFPDGLAVRGTDGGVTPAGGTTASQYEEGSRRLLARAHELSRLDHLGLARSRSPIEERGTVYAVTSVADGQALRAWVRSLARPPQQSDMDALLGPLLDGLAALHGAGLLHLAITPDAIVVKSTGEGVLTHLYAGVLLPGRAHSCDGIADYAAPELLDARAADIGPRTDVYGLAATVYAALTGAPPARPSSAQGQTWMPPPIPCSGTEYRPEFLQAVAMSLAPDPILRPPGVAALKHLWLEDGLTEVPTVERSEEQAPAPATPPPRAPASAPIAPPESVQRISRMRVPWLVIVLLAGGIVGGLTYLGMRPTLPPAPHKSGTETTPPIRAPAPSAARPETPAQPPRSQAGDAAQSMRKRIAETFDRNELAQLAETNPEQREAVETRLIALGYVRLVKRDAAVWLRPGGAESFSECHDCPEMVVLPAGTFLMGSPGTQSGRQEDEDDTPGPGGSPMSVTIARPFAIGKYEVSRGQFAAFAQATGHRVDGGCYAREGGRRLRPELSWTSPGFEQNEDHPVICVGWRDAVAYVEWLSAMTGAHYRLLTETEWEYAARSGSDGRYAFGDEDGQICKYGNGADLTSRETDPGWIAAACRDGFRFTAPVASFLPNAYRLFDMHGNVWEWVEDCASDSLRHLSGPEASHFAGKDRSCSPDKSRMLRGGSWSDPPQRLRSAARIAGPPDARDQIVGFRVARTLEQ